MTQRLQKDMGEPWQPCEPTTLCRNCKHGMSGHFRQNPAQRNSGTYCGEPGCGCPVWFCQHTGHSTKPAVYA